MEQKNEKCLVMLRTALEMEQKGRRFYEKAAAECANEAAQEVFRRLGGEEIIHETRIKTISESLLADGSWTADWKSLAGHEESLASLLREIADKHRAEIKSNPTDIKAVEIGIDFETASVKFYKEHLNRATEPLEKEFIGQMVKEEEKHFLALTDTKFYLQDPDAYFMEKEHSHLDGG